MRAWLREILRTGAALRRLFVVVDVGLGQLALLLFSLLCMTVLEGLGIGLLIPLFGLIATPGQVNTRALQWLHRLVPGQAPIVYVLIVAVAVIIAIGLKNVFSVWTAARSARLQREMTVQLRTRLYARLEHAALTVFERTSAGSLASLFGQETQRTAFALSAALALTQTTLMACIYMAMLAWISGPLGLCALASGGAIATIVNLYSRHLQNVGNEVTSSNLGLAARLTETFTGVRTTRVAHAQRYERARVEEASRAQAVAEERHGRGQAALQPLVESLAVVAAMVLVGGAERWLVVPGRMTPVALMGFGLVLLRLLPIFRGFYGTQAQLLYFAGGVDAILEWLQIAQYPTRPFGSRTTGRIEREIVIQDLHFVYDPSRPVLAGLSFAIQAHQLTAVVGRSGSGKSTLAALLLRLYEPQGGRILVDGCDYWDFTDESWHRFVAFVEQDPFIFSDTVGANVAYGCSTASPADITRALMVAQLGEFVASLPQGLDTELGERGVTMSGGQRQRLAIARAIVRDPELLILDEATSHLDTISESQLQRALFDAARGRTTLVIAHRLSTIKHADHIVVMDHGRIVEQGRWKELESKGGVFQELLRHDLRDA